MIYIIILDYILLCIFIYNYFCCDVSTATVLSMSSFPPSKSPENSITEMDPFESPSSPSSSSKPSITEVFQLKDYKDFTYRGI